VRQPAAQWRLKTVTITAYDIASNRLHSSASRAVRAAPPEQQTSLAKLNLQQPKPPSGVQRAQLIAPVGRTRKRTRPTFGYSHLSQVGGTDLSDKASPLSTASLETPLAGIHRSRHPGATASRNFQHQTGLRPFNTSAVAHVRQQVPVTWHKPSSMATTSASTESRQQQAPHLSAPVASTSGQSNTLRRQRRRQMLTCRSEGKSRQSEIASPHSLFASRKCSLI
jgi:hypothetical protein